MQSPPDEVSLSERVLNDKEIEELSCTIKARAYASRYDGKILESEFVTQDERFGYIYRYDIVDYIVDDGSFHPEMGRKGMVSEVKSKLAIYSLDCVHFNIVSGPAEQKKQY